MTSLTGKRTLLTGASSGIGRATAIELAKQGAVLFLTARDQARLEQTRAACVEAGSPAVHVLTADVSQPSECKRLVEAAVRELGGLDVLINNAGSIVWGPFREISDPALIAWQTDTNYSSVVYTTHYALPHLIASKGRLAGVSSIAGLISIPNEALYCGTKHAIYGFLDSLRVELRGTGVSVSVLAPDVIATDILGTAMTPEGARYGKRFARSEYMSAEKCAQIFVHGLARRKRLIMTTFRSHFAVFARQFAPWIVDYMTTRAIATLKLETHTVESS
jgi:short-subunit dehydrogenase